MSTPLKVDTSSSEKKMKSPRKSLNTKTILEGSQKLETNKLAKHSLLSGSAKIMEKDKVVTEATKTMSLHELNSNLLAIFDQWDSDNSDELDLRELQVGFYNAGIFIKHKKMLRYLRKCSSRKNHNQCVRANEFSKFMQMIAGNNTKILRVIVQKIAVAIPRERVRPSHYLDIKDTDGERKKSKSGNEDDDNILDAFDNVVSAEVLMQNNIFDPRIMFEYVTFQRGIFPAVFAFLAWQMGFSIFYWAYDDFRFDRAFYYSAQAGLSVGFGSLSEEYEGGLIDSAPCGMSTLNISQENHSTHNATRTSNTLNSLNTGDTNYTSSTLRSSGEYDVSKFVTILNVILGSSVIGGALGYFVDLVLQDKESWYEKIKNVDEIEKHKKEIEDEKAKQGCCTAKIETLHLELIEVYRANEAECKITLFVICLLTASIIFGMVEEDFTFITAMYYGVTSMSTAGLQGPNPESRASMIFTGLLVLIGVPTYGVCLGFFANALVSKAQAKREADAMHSAISKSEFLYAAKLAGHAEHGSLDDDMDRIDFLQMELLRTGRCDMDLLSEIDHKFQTYDVDGSGSVTWIELVAHNVFDQFDTDGSGAIDFQEFKKCVDSLPKRLLGNHDLDDKTIHSIFELCDIAGDDATMSRKEFGTFVEALSNGELDVFIKNEGAYEAQTKAVRELHGTEKVIPVDDSNESSSRGGDDESSSKLSDGDM